MRRFFSFLFDGVDDFFGRGEADISQDHGFGQLAKNFFSLFIAAQEFGKPLCEVFARGS